MASKYYRKHLAQVKPEERQFVKKNLDIVEQIVAILNEKTMRQRDLARLLGKTDAEVSRMLSGLHNLTVKTLARLEVALEQDIIITPLKAHENHIGLKLGKVVSFSSQTLHIAAVGETYVYYGKQSLEMKAFKREGEKKKSSLPANRIENFTRTAATVI